jgi:hypothetical protein
MIEPTIMDGVPNEPGFYFINHHLWDWLVVHISEYNEGLCAINHDRGLSVKVYEDEFSDYTWSERIAEPTD